MARDSGIEARLWRWAEWRNAGDGGGYPVKNTLHPSWSPPSPGQTPTLRTMPHNDARQTHALVAKLAPAKVATLEAHYVRRLTNHMAAELLGCRPDTVAARVEAAHRDLLRLLSAERGEFCNIGG